MDAIAGAVQGRKERRWRSLNLARFAGERRMCKATSLTVYLKLTECFAQMVNAIRPGGNSKTRLKKLSKHGTEGKKGVKNDLQSMGMP